MHEKEQRAHADKVLAAYTFALSAQWNVTEHIHYWTTVTKSLKRSVVEQLKWVAQQPHTFAYKVNLLDQLETLIQEHAVADKATQYTQEAEITLLMQRITRPARNPYYLRNP